MNSPMNQPFRRRKSKALKCFENSSLWYSSDQTNAGSWDEVCTLELCDWVGMENINLQNAILLRCRRHIRTLAPACHVWCSTQLLRQWHAMWSYPVCLDSNTSHCIDWNWLCRDVSPVKLEYFVDELDIWQYFRSFIPLCHRRRRQQWLLLLGDSGLKIWWSWPPH